MKTLFDLCTIEEGRRKKGAICEKVKGRIGDGDAEQCMEERLLGESEYVLLRGSMDRDICRTAKGGEHHRCPKP